MAAFELVIWFVLYLTLIVAAIRFRSPAPEVGGITVYRRGGFGAPVVPYPGRYRSISRLQGTFDGVVVPSARGAENLLRAAHTAQNAGVKLVVLASGKTDAAEVRRLLGEECIVFDDLVHFPAPGPRTVRHPCASSADLSGKRNRGLAIARGLGWRTVLFVDDDVQAIPRHELVRAAELLAGVDRGDVPRRLVGWTFDRFSDLSTLGHARSYAADERVSFVSGGAMVIRCDPLPPFFPPVYNEDLLVELELLREDPDSVCVVGTLTQDPYDPFSDPARAVSQEFGEILVEGWARKPTSTDLRRPAFWEQVLFERRTLLTTSATTLEERGMIDGARALRAACAAHQSYSPQLLARFVDDWAHDMGSWREFLNSTSAA